MWDKSLTVMGFSIDDWGEDPVRIFLRLGFCHLIELEILNVIKV
jgi:hypothetical protein